jgi:plastocyanin
MQTLSGYRTRFLFLAALLLLPFASGCHKSSSSSTGGFSTGALAIDVQASRVSGTTQSEFEFQVLKVSGASDIASVSWSFGDGNTASGPSVKHSFATAGLWTVEASVSSTSNETLQSGVAVQVFDPSNTRVGPGGQSITFIPGDVNGDDALTVEDAHLTLLHATHLQRFTTPDALQAADANWDGRITEADAEFIAQAVAASSTVPNQLSIGAASPGTLFQILSPQLLDLDATFTVKVGDAPAYAPYRPMPGYANAFVPMTVVPTAELRSFAPRSVPVELFADDVKVASYTLDLAPATPSNVAPLAAINQLYDELETRLAEAKTSIAPYLQLTGTSDPNNSALLLSMLQLVEEQTAEARRVLTEQLTLLDAQSLEILALLWEANGLAADLQEFGASTPPTRAAGGDDFLAAICAIESVSKVISTVDKYTSIACAGFQLAALFPTPAAPVFAALATVCNAFSISKTIFDVLNDFFPTVLPDLALEANPAQVLPGKSSQLTLYIQISPAAGLCAGGVKTLTDKIIEKVVLRFLKSATIKTAFNLLKNLPLEKRNEIRAKVVEKIRNLFMKVVGTIISVTGLDTVMQDLFKSLCSHLNGISTRLQADARGRVTGPAPATAGQVASGPGETVTFTSDTQYDGPAVFTAAISGCKGIKANGQVTVQCVQGEKGVRFCIGDNGSALDDIFELRVNGKTQLTSSVPVRNICTTLQLPFGKHQVQMYGRAAPDAIGTYFLSITGATVLSGPPLTGSNLTAGALFTWTIEVK